MTILKLYISFFQIGLFSIGGGYAALPLIQNQIVDIHHWLSMNEFVDIVTISQMTPGPIAINAATFVGMRVGGVWGSIIATVGCVTPSCIIVLSLAWFYFKYKELDVVQGVLGGLRPVAVAMIASSAASIILMTFFGSEAGSWRKIDLSQIDFISLALFAAGFLILRKFKLNPIYVMLACGAAGLALYSIF